MKSTAKGRFSKTLNNIILSGILFVFMFCSQSAFAGFDTIYFSANGDSTATTMTQGAEIGFGSNCELGASMLWEIWIDHNGNSIIDATDGLLLSEHFTDGFMLSEGNATPDGSIFVGSFALYVEPGLIILRTTDLATDSSLQIVVTVNALVSPTNQFNGQISLPSITPPNALLANRLVIAESDTGDEGVAIAVTDNNGNYSLPFGADATGIEIFIESNDFEGFVSPGVLSATASGVVGGNDFVYTAAVDSVYGFVKDELGAIIPFETDVSASSGANEKYTTTKNGRYVFYFSNAQKGEWFLQHDSRNAPLHLGPQGISFSHDTLASFQHDLILRNTNAVIYAKITENSALPANNYGVFAYSDLLDASGEAVSDIGANNVVAIAVSSADASNWSVEIVTWDEDYPVPFGLTSQTFYNVSIGDTVSLNLVTGHSISGTFTQDPGDNPIFWDDVWVGSGTGGTNLNPDGTFEYFTSASLQDVFPFANGYITNPQFRRLNVTGDIAGVDFVINETHSSVSGTLLNVTLPLDNSFYTVTAQTGNDGTDGYMVFADVDSATGTFTMELCDGDWTLTPPCCLGIIDPATANLLIGEAPADVSKTVDFDYGSSSCCVGTRGNIDGGFDDGTIVNSIDIADLVYLVDYMFKGGPVPPCFDEANVTGDPDPLDIAELVYLVNYMFRGGPVPVLCP